MSRTGFVRDDAIRKARHDKVNLDVRIIYKGQPIVFPDKVPTADELMNDPDGASRMAGWLGRPLADRAATFVDGDQQGVTLRFWTLRERSFLSLLAAGSMLHHCREMA